MPLLILFLISHQAMAWNQQELIGRWKFSEILYQGRRLPRPNPDLNLQWEFYQNQTSRLYWDRGSKDFCERFAYFTLQENDLIEEVFALNPKNAVDCQQDPDMKIGKKARVPIALINKELHLYFQLGDEEIVYILLRLEG